MKGFKKIKHEKQKDIYGGNGLILAIGMVMTMVIKSVVSAVSSIKMLSSSKGSVKIEGYESKWEDDVKSKVAIENTQRRHSSSGSRQSSNSIHEYYSAY